MYFPSGKPEQILTLSTVMCLKYYKKVFPKVIYSFPYSDMITSTRKPNFHKGIFTLHKIFVCVRQWSFSKILYLYMCGYYFHQETPISTHQTSELYDMYCGMMSNHLLLPAGKPTSTHRHQGMYCGMTVYHLLLPAGKPISTQYLYCNM